ncbi:hypothetical protein [Bartonella sp. HY761]|uniref:hypothetical protein n=1 Tax=Bartonella sp. HY761 TaxID=2979330 RepID=UPI0021FF246E|nr:hypothetical protein [Bartonella sp. HY761]UXN06242.1 hypothetical protein N6A79_13380 [Bartonella sp. HY761]
MRSTLQKIKITLVISASLLTIIGLVIKCDFGQERPHQIAFDYDKQSTPRSDRLFRDYGEPVYHLAQKIEREQTINQSELAALPPNGINQRYGDETTLLFHAMAQHNVQAIDLLIGNGADYTMAKRPLLNSEPEFISALDSFGDNDEAADRIYRTKLIEIYLKHGGDPNFRFRQANDRPLVMMVALAQNYDGVHILVEAGANIWARNDNGINLVGQLGLSITGYEELSKLIDEGYLDNIQMNDIVDAMAYISAYKQRGDEQSKNRQILAMKILKRYPQYEADENTQDIFGGPIPWEQINNLSIPKNQQTNK